MGQQAELLARLVVGTVLGASIGYERDVHGRPAGLRTHRRVGLASTTFMRAPTTRSTSRSDGCSTRDERLQVLVAQPGVKRVRIEPSG